MSARSNRGRHDGLQQQCDSRIDAFLAQMTLREKVDELKQAWRFTREPDAETGLDRATGLQAEPTYGILTMRPPNARLGIPVIAPNDPSVTYGVLVWPGMSWEPTMFPSALGLSSTWAPELLERVAGVIAREARAMGFHQLYGPVLDVARDPRFGRFQESFGEDPYLVARMGVAFIHGLQGRGDARFDHEHVVACAKHFAGYHDGARGINGEAADISERMLREVHFPPFEAAVREAKVGSIMPAHTDISGLPCHANQWLLTTVLRDEWGFDGFVVTDAVDISRLKDQHRIVTSYSEAAVLALHAGCDQDLGAGGDLECYGEPLLEALECGAVDEAVVDRSVRRILNTKLRLGLLDQAPSPPTDPHVIGASDHRRLALEVARRGAVLLKNDDPLLPLDRTTLRSVAVIGPNAAVDRLGHPVAGSPVAIPGVSVLEGIGDLVGAAVDVHYAPGCAIHDAVREGFTEAAATARSADVAIVVLGDSLTGGGETCGEGFDRDDLALPGVQEPLLKAVHATGTPVVLVLLNGRPPDLRWAAEYVPAILESWYPGVEGGRAIAELIFGDCNPSGKLTVSFPRSVGQLPVVYRERAPFPGMGQGQYIAADRTALFPFGHGLSYTSFAYENLRVAPAAIEAYEEATVSVDVTNVGVRSGDEIVQLYIRDEVASVTRPLKELKGFKRISLEPHETRTVSFTVGFDVLCLYDKRFRRVVEPGMFALMVGPSSVEHDTVTLEVT
jgi:beta-glucosidase